MYIPKLPILAREITVNRQQFALVVTIGLLGSLPPLAGGTAAKADDWRTTTSDNGGGSTLTGKLFRNSADQNGSAPYVLLDKWGVVRGYVAAGHGVDLESSIGKQVSLQGAVRTLPGGDMPYMNCAKVIGGSGEPAPEASARLNDDGVRGPSSGFTPVATPTASTASANCPQPGRAVAGSRARAATGARE